MLPPISLRRLRPLQRLYGGGRALIGRRGDEFNRNEMPRQPHKCQKTPET